MDNLSYDLMVIGAYFAFMLVIGVMFGRTSSNVSDYFRGGGSMTWWMTGSSSFLTTFTAWTFTGVAGAVYKQGTLISAMFIFNAITSLIVAIFLAHRYRRMRVITPVDAIYKRFGRLNEQIFAWQSVVMQLIIGGISLYVVAVFISPIIGVGIGECILISGVVVVFMSITGGAWAVVASDFVQMLVILTITIVAAFLVLRMPEVGGVGGLFESMPAQQTDWTTLARPEIVFLWLLAMFVNQFTNYTNIQQGAARYLFVRSDIDARKAAVMVSIGFLLGSVIWLVPPMAASFVIPEEVLNEQFSYMKNPYEASYAAICMMIFPQGLLGLLVCGVFAATMSSMDSALNRNSGIIVCNIYQPLFRPNASDRELLFVGKLCTALVGVCLIAVGFGFWHFSDLPLFDWFLLIGALMNIPLFIPLMYGMFVAKTPDWACWSSVIVGVIFAVLGRFVIDPVWVGSLLGMENLSELEISYLKFSIMLLTMISTTTIWFFFTMLFSRSHETERRVSSFFTDLETPVVADSEKPDEIEQMQYRRLGLICLVYGGVITLFALIPNPLWGRACFIFCGGVIAIVGFFLYRRSATLPTMQPL